MPSPFLPIASFRGIPFRIESADTSFGRRNVTHEYPLRDTPYAEDLGKKAREYTINAYEMGTGYTVLRTLLINAIEKNKTPGMLIHPIFGPKTVTPKNCTHRFSNREGGIEYFELTFVEAGSNLFPDIVTDFIGLFNIGKIDALSSMITRFAVTYSIAKAPEFLRSASTTLGTDVSDSVLSSASFGVINSAAYPDFLSDNTAYQDNIQTLTAAPEDFAKGITGLTSSLSTLYDNPTDAYEAQKSLLDFDSGILPVNPSTPNRLRQKNNQAEIINLTKGAVLVEMAAAIMRMTFDSVDDAIAMRDEFDALIDAQMTLMANDGIDAQYVALADIRTTVLGYINEVAIALYRVVEVAILDSMPALVFAYNKYGDAERDQEIIDRNNITNPAFLPPHSNIQALEQ
jgi:prophage DNA circulation protein